MNEPAPNLTTNQLDTAGFLINWAVTQYYGFSLVLTRMSGLMIVGPLFGQPVVPMNVRILLVVVLSLLVTPMLSMQSQRRFAELDVDRNGRLSDEEIPLQVAARFAVSGSDSNLNITYADYNPTPQMPSSLLNYAWIAAGELLLGLMLGLGVYIFMSSLQLAGELIDQQSGLSLSNVVNPAMDVSASNSGQFLFLLGTIIFLVMAPANGHLMMLSALMETFQTLPIGAAFVSTSAIEYFSRLVHQSLVLAVQIAAPVLATMSLIALTMGFLGRTVPQINVLVVGFAVRVMAQMLLLTLILSGMARHIIDTIPVILQTMHSLLTGL